MSDYIRQHAARLAAEAPPLTEAAKARLSGLLLSPALPEVSPLPVTAARQVVALADQQRAA